MAKHPHFEMTYTWTGEFWQVFHRKYVKSTMFRFISKNK
jgi:hypothetical protein